jgi:hypothetical protein
MKYHFPDNDFNVFGIQCPDVAEAVLKNNARVDFGAVSESHGDDLKNDAAPVFKNNARIVFRGHLGISNRRPGKTMLPSFCETMRALFSGPFQHLTSKTC